jgi:hypothetical protein
MKFALAVLTALLASCGGGPWDDNERESEATTGSSTAATTGSSTAAPYNPNGTLVLIYDTPSAATPVAPVK